MRPLEPNRTKTESDEAFLARCYTHLGEYHSYELGKDAFEEVKRLAEKGDAFALALIGFDQFKHSHYRLSTLSHGPLPMDETQERAFATLEKAVQEGCKEANKILYLLHLGVYGKIEGDKEKAVPYYAVYHGVSTAEALEQLEAYLQKNYRAIRDVQSEQKIKSYLESLPPDYDVTYGSPDPDLKAEREKGENR